MSALSLNEIIDVNITLQSAAVPQPAFSVTLIMGSSAAIEDVIKYYDDPSDILTDGFDVSDQEYIDALELFEQAVQPEEFAVACNAPTSVAQIATVTVTGGAVSEGLILTLSIGDAATSYTCTEEDTVNTALVALAALVNAKTALNVKCTVSTTTMTITAWNWTIQVSSHTETGGAEWPGVGFTATGTANLTVAAGTANTSMAAYINTVLAQDTGWYCVNLCSINWYDILNMAALIESQTLLYIATSADTAIIDSEATDDVLSQLMGLDYNRTALLYSAQASDGADSGWTGTTIAIVPGATTWGDTAIVGIDPDNLSASQFNAVSPKPGTSGGKNGNSYVTVGGNNVVLWGQCVSGRFIDITVGLDWLVSEIQGNIWASIVAARAAGGKIPYTNKGSAVFVGNVKEAIDDGATNGLIDDTQPISITVPDVSTQTLTNKTNRIAPPVAFSCTLAGAYSTATVNGVLSV